MLTTVQRASDPESHRFDGLSAAPDTSQDQESQVGRTRGFEYCESSVRSVCCLCLALLIDRNSALRWRAERELKQGAVDNHERRRITS